MAQLHEKIYDAPAPILEIVDVGPLFPGHEQTPGVYLCAEQPNITADHTKATPPAIVYRSFDEGTNWDQIAVLDQMVEHGLLGPAESDTIVPSVGHLKTQSATLPFGWDTASELDVTFAKSYTPETAPELEVLNGANRLIVGKEVLQFKTATLDEAAVNAYTLTNLLRGTQGSETVLSELTAGDRVLVVSPDTFHFLALNPADVGTTLYLKVVSPGQALSDVAQITHTVEALNVSPWGPATVAGSRDGSNNLTITWNRRTRATVRAFGVQGRPLFEDLETYEVDIYDSVPAVVRTITVTTESASYTAAQQTTDGLTPGDPVSLRVYQTSRLTDRGRPAIATV